MAEVDKDGNGKKWWLSVAATVVGAVLIALLFMAAAVPSQVAANSRSIEINTKRIEAAEARTEKALEAIRAEQAEQRRLSVEILRELKK